VRIVVFGAAGGIGRQIVMQAVGHGHDVTAVVHSSPLDLDLPGLTAVTGDVLDFDSVSALVQGHDAVFFALSHARGSSGSTLTDGVGNVIHAMAVHGVRRLVAVSAAGTFARDDKRLSMGFRTMMKTVLRSVYDELEAMERRIMASDLDWCIVRPVGLTDDQLTGQYRVGLDGSILPKATRVSRADVAALMLKAAAGETYVRRAVTIGY
jgi:putative NADH-flavin reductase